MLDRYGDAIELDLAFKTPYRLGDFFRGDETPNTLHNLIAAFKKQRTSYLSAAMATDMELYEANLDGPKVKGDPSPELTEVDLLTSVVMGVSEQLQALTHLAAKAKGRPKIKHLPRPKTAEDLYKREQARQAFNHLEGVIKYVPRDEFEKNLREG